MIATRMYHLRENEKYYPSNSWAPCKTGADSRSSSFTYAKVSRSSDNYEFRGIAGIVPFICMTLDGNLASKDTLPKQPGNHIFNCRTRSAGGTGLVECLMKTIGCPWALSFGDTRYCKHPSAGRLANPGQP